MAEKSVNNKQKRFIEEMGIVFEDAGMPRMAGRILGWLLICDPPHQSSGQLATVVEGSKGSISTMTRMLVSLRLVERMTMPGDHRSTYYQISPGAWSELLRKRVAEITIWRQAAERGIRLMKGSNRQLRRRLEEMRDIHIFFERELPTLLERWERRRDKRE